MADLAVGDRVYLRNNLPPGTNPTTTVCEVVVINDEETSPGKLVGVKLPTANLFAHTCDGLVEQGFGWWTRPENCQKDNA